MIYVLAGCFCLLGAALAFIWIDVKARRRQASTPPHTPTLRESGTRGIYRVDDVQELERGGLSVRDLGHGLVVVDWPSPGVHVDQGTPRVREVIRGPDGAIWVATPGLDITKPWNLERGPWRPRAAAPRGARQVA